jgi:predicted RND superfamily exporter protein
VLGLAAILVAVSLSLALRLRVQPGFEHLLPESRPSVHELERVKQRTTGVSTVFILLEGDDTGALRKAADAIVTETREIGYPWVGSAESGPHEAIAFFKPRAGLFADVGKLQEVLDDYDAEVGKATGASLDDEDDDDDGKPKQLSAKFSADSLKKRFGIDGAEKKRLPEFPDGYYQSEHGKAVVVALRSAILGTDYEAGNKALALIKDAIQRVGPKSYHASIRYGLAGDLVSSIAEYKAINDDLTDVGIVGGVMIVAVVFLYFLRMRTLLSMVITIVIGVSLTFGATQLLVGQLNMATGFLFTIVAGNGINPGIIYMARYLELRREGSSNASAIRAAHRDTWLPTLTAAIAASASYASLVITEFRGFRDFGIIGGVGMTLCWLATYAFLPSILVVAEGVSSLKSDRAGLFGLLPKGAAGGMRFGVPFAAIVSNWPRAATVLGLVVTVASSVATFFWIARDPMEYDLHNLKTDMSKRAEQERVGELSVKITGYIGADGMAILVDRPDQVPLLVKELERRRDQAPPDAKPFKGIYTLQDLVPQDQAKKIPLLREIKDRVLRAKKRGMIKPEDFSKLEQYLPPDDLKQYDIGDLPEAAARAFTERDGTRGRIVFIEPLSREHVEDAHYLFRWADSYRRTELPDNKGVVLGSGRAVIYADIWAAVIGDVPKAVALSLTLTLVVVAICFRRGSATMMIMASLLGGVLWMTAALALSKVRLNFLNFIALPITFGIAVDYPVNIVGRYLKEGAGGVITAVRETGGAVVLCSMTTTVGYLALVRSMNYAVRSMGVAAVLGEVSCLLFAVIVFPAAVYWRDRRRANASTPRAKSLERAA